MTLDEAIKHCEDVAETCEFDASHCDETDRYEQHEMCELGKCAKEHKQLAEWLKELKERRKQQCGKWEDEKYLIGCDVWTAQCSNCQTNIETTYMPSQAFEWCPFCGTNMKCGTTNNTSSYSDCKESTCNNKSTTCKIKF